MVSEVLVPADAELEAGTEARTRLAAMSLGFTGPVGTKIPSSRPSEFVRIYTTGGTSPDIASDAPQLTVEGYAETALRARLLCASTVAALQAAGRDGWMGSIPCRRVVVFGLPANLPDPNVTDRYRYSSLVSAVLRRTAL